MHPAYSVILFTTASGAGYGMLVWLAIGRLFGGLMPSPWLGFWAFGLALGLITIGLLSSTFHLGRPERAWRAVSQWRSSWLSREGVAALVAYVPAGLLALAWVVADYIPIAPLMPALEVATVFMALITVYCTGMIYASLPTIPEWHLPRLVPAVYIALALASGAVGLAAVHGLATGHVPLWLALVALGATALGFLVKLAYWSAIDGRLATRTAESATGLGHLGRVRPLDPPHTEANFVMREMGYRVARKHAERLRGLARLAGFGLPAILLLATLVLPTGAGGPLATLASLAMALGLIVERWLFFAEARHVVTLYYGAERV